MSKVIAYLRVSTDSQDNDNQRQGFDSFCGKRGIVIDQWVEDKITGTSKAKDRLLGEVIAGLESGDTLIFSEFSRVGRSVYAVFTLLQDCIEKGVTVYTIKEGFTLSNDIFGKVSAVMLALIADVERSLMVERVKETYQRKRKEADSKNEKVVWGRPSGKKTDMSKRKLDPFRDEIAEMVRNRVPKIKIAWHFKSDRVTLDRYLRDTGINA